MPAADTLLQNRYRIVRLIGQGGMGSVYEARDQRLGSTVALKETLFDDAEMCLAFEREARILANLRHPALPKVSDHFVEGSRRFLVMEFIAGSDLGILLKQNGKPFPVADALAWADQLLDVLEYLHAQKTPVIHRDIKPQNLKLTDGNKVILLDFGLAKGMIRNTDASANRSVFGYTPNYAPPEQMQGTGTDARSDIYGLAATLYHLTTVHKPSDALTRAMNLVNGLADSLRPAHHLNPDVPIAVSDLIQQALSLNREHRPASAAEMRRKLHKIERPANFSGPLEQRPAAGSESPTVIHPSSGAKPAPRPDSGKKSSIPQPPANETVRMPASPASLPERLRSKALVGHTAGVNCVAFSPSGTHVLSGSQDTTVRLWDVETGREALKFERHASSVESVAFSPDGKTVLVGNRDGNIRLPETETGQEILRFQGHVGSVHALVFRKNGTQAYSAGADKTVRLWDLRSGSQIACFDEHADVVASLALSDDERFLVSASADRTVIVRDVEKGRVHRVLRHPDAVHGAALVSDRETVITACADRVVRLWNLESGRELRRLEGHSDAVKRVAASPNGQLAVSGDANGLMIVWDLDQAETVRRLSEHKFGVADVAFSPDGHGLASAGRDKTIRIWSLVS